MIVNCFYTYSIVRAFKLNIMKHSFSINAGTPPNWDANIPSYFFQLTNMFQIRECESAIT